MPYRQTVKSWNDKITFGKFKGKTFGEILEEQASCITWLDDNEIVEFPRWMIDAAHENSESEDETGVGSWWDGEWYKQ